ncbi:Transposon Tf2-9 polyprotein [Araneus ventricosus]|uniref:Transposon Tf2-9 polyprotein n=1 Tax=Araneus ventricosus TaxID=182803 RepID=A0A4Y2J2C0_ARAVE|nr:Transposon Tf2-9 polyprotein [Araneus ventricosus]GBM83740.1 Transposon Tf2-9 polyprotein [Araneus ventricosus]
MPNSNDKNKETVDNSANTDVPMENTHISDPHIIPFDSENGMKMELWLQHFNDTCKQHNKYEDWKVNKLNLPRQHARPVRTVPPTDRTFQYLSIDTVGGFNYYNSTKKYLHLVIDHATRYVWGFPSKSETTETYVNCLKQVFQIQVPTKLLSDRNGAFTSSKFKRFLRNYNVKHLLTSSHHPQTNGKCERVNQSIVTKLKCKVNSSSTKTPWTKLLEQVINEYNLTPHSVTKFPPAYLLFCTLHYSPPLTQNQFYRSVEEARKLAKQNTIKYNDKSKIKYDARFIDCPFKAGDIVMYEEFNYPNRRKLSPVFSGPYEIVKELSDVNYEITKPNALTKKPTEIVHASKLRTFYPPEELKLSHE